MTQTPSGSPRYQQIADDLRSKIANGAIKVGDQLPAYATLGQTYRCDKNTALRAITVLRDEGLVATTQGVAGAAVIRKPGSKAPSPEALAAQMAGIKQEVRDHARMLARIRRRLEEAGITLADTDQQDEQAI